MVPRCASSRNSRSRWTSSTLALRSVALIEGYPSETSARPNGRTRAGWERGGDRDGPRLAGAAGGACVALPGARGGGARVPHEPARLPADAARDHAGPRGPLGRRRGRGETRGEPVRAARVQGARRIVGGGPPTG